MNQQACLILVQNTSSGEIKDITSEVSSFKINMEGTNITFDSGKSYTYKRGRIEIFAKPARVGGTDSIICADGFPLDDCAALSFGDYIKVFYNDGRTDLFKRERVTIRKSCLSNNHPKMIFGYFKAMSHFITPADEERKILSDQYEAISVINEDSVLASYLSGAPILPRTDTETLVFPFETNLSQKKAVRAAFSNSISIIEGPPGTGKTQTILNIIANIAIRGKSVAVVSANNSAIANVQEKLEKDGYGFLTALLGNTDNQSEFFNNGQSPASIPQNWHQSMDVIVGAKKRLVTIENALNKMLEIKNDVAILKEEVTKFKLEQSYFDDMFQTEGIPLSRFAYRTDWPNDKILSFIYHLEGVAVNEREDSLRTKLVLFFRYGIYKFNYLYSHLNQIITSLHRLYYRNSINTRENEIASKTAMISNMNCDELMVEQRRLSDIVFKDSIYQRFARQDRPKYNKGSFKNRFQRFIEDYPVLLSTTHSIRRSISQNYLFDYLIIDEASQTDLITAALAMSCCKNIVIVGDVKQLGQIVNSECAKASDDMVKQLHIDEVYNYKRHNILSSVAKLYDGKVSRTLLREHYRCHPQIIGFCNEKFYNNQLIVMTESRPDDRPLNLYKTVPGKHGRYVQTQSEQGRYNLRQIEVINDEIIGPNPEKYGDCGGVGVISPYRMHVKETYKYIKIPKLEVDTVHKFQGREKKTIIYATVADHITPHNDNANLINVAVSRAVSELIVVTGSQLIRKHGTNIGDLIRYIEYHAQTGTVLKSEKASVFDLLYSENSERLIAALKRGRKVSTYTSENLMYGVITDVLKEDSFQSFRCVVHVPLNRIIRDVSRLSDSERAFALHPWSHVDFLLFNKIDKEPVLAIEVDGFAFHRNSDKQRRRDDLKNSIFQKIGLPILRFATEGSGEREALKAKLLEIVSTS